MRLRGRSIVVASTGLLLWASGAATGVRAQSATLDAPMNPIGKTDAAPSRCAKCPLAEAKDLEVRRVADRSAPEYQGGRRSVPDPEMEPSVTAGAALPGGQLPIAVPLR